MAPKIGPRGITIQDVQNVATNGLPKQGAATYESTWKPATTTAFNPQLLANLMAGQAQPTYGQKYGGFPSREMLNDAALGYAYNWRDVADLASAQQQSLTAPLESRFGDVLSTNKANLAFRTAVEPKTTEPAQIKPFTFRPVNPVIQDANARALAARQARMAASNQAAEKQFITDYNAQVLPYEQLASTIRETPISTLARQALTNLYGIDPNVARATFNEQTDLDYAKLQREAELAAAGIDFGKTEAELIFDNYGPDALIEWQTNKANEAITGTPAQQKAAAQAVIDAQNLETDLAIENSYGIRPSQVTGVSADTVRSMFSDPTFVQDWIMPSLDSLSANDGQLTGAEVAAAQGQAYLEKNPGDLLRARALAAIIAEFDFMAR